MGRWSDGLFEDDLSLDIQGTFEDAVAEGATPADAARALMTCELAEKILGEYEDDEGYFEENMGFFLAVSFFQLQNNAVDPRLKKMALQAITWESENAEPEPERAALLDELGKQLRAS
jgi:hypothetical protein